MPNTHFAPHNQSQLLLRLADKMLSKKAERLFCKISNWGFTLGLSTTRWDLDKHQLVISSSPRRLLWEKFQLFLVFLYEAFLCWQSTKSVMKNEPVLANVPVFYLAALWILMNCNLLGSFHGQEYVRVFNGAHDFVVKRTFQKGTFVVRWTPFFLF